MRISDWSSDVCSSDLLRYVVGVEANPVKSLRRDKIGPVVVIAGPHEQKRTGDIEDSATPSFPSANAGYKASDAGRRISRPSLRFHKPANAKAYRGIVFIIMHRFGFVGFLAGAFARQAHRHAITEIHVQPIPPFRSEEHTSELQPLIRI